MNHIFVLSLFMSIVHLIIGIFGMYAISNAYVNSYEFSTNTQILLWWCDIYNFLVTFSYIVLSCTKYLIPYTKYIFIISFQGVFTHLIFLLVLNELLKCDDNYINIFLIVSSIMAIIQFIIMVMLIRCEHKSRDQNNQGSDNEGSDKEEIEIVGIEAINV